MSTSLARLAVLVATLVMTAACGDTATPVPRGTGGTGGSAATGGTGGSAGTGGTAGTGGMGATGGSAGTGGAAGTGGEAGTGGVAGVGGTGGATGECQTNALCHTCPDRFLCESNDDCAFSGYVCVASGCETNEGAPIKQCQPSQGGSCSTDAECPNTSDYDCMAVGASGTRCVRVTPGCDPANEAYDCVPGFSCEGGACVDRRVPCDSYLDCPYSHVCSTTPTASFCVRVYRTCHEDADCDGFGRYCADIDGDGTKECAGELGGPGEPCLNSDCAGTSAPVCEAGPSGALASCGDHGLCRNSGDCDTGFECVALWQDGRSECVPVNGTCERVTDCPIQQVCAAPRSGNPPSCQAGTAP